MGEHEAREILDRRVAELRTLSYEDLVDRFLHDHPARRDPTWEKVLAASGTTYWLKIYAYWDSQAQSDVRVFVDLHDDAKEYVRQPLGDDFIVAPDASFVGE